VTDSDRSTGLRRILGDVAGFAGSQYFLRFTGLLKGFLVARILGPEGNGLWQHFVIISEYCQYSHAGALQGLNKVLGHRVGRGDDEGARASRANGNGGILGAAVVLWVALVGYVALRWDDLPAWDRWGLPLVGLLAVSEQVAFLYMTMLRAYSRIHLISVTETAFALLNLVVSVALLLKFGVLGLLVGWLATRAATALWMIRRSGYEFRPAFSWPEIRVLLVTGFPIYLFQLTRVGLRNIDRVLVDSVLDKSQLGIYALAVTLAGLVRYVADAVGFVIYPIFLRNFGETGDPRTAREHLAKPTELLSLLVPIVLGVSWLVLQLPVLWLLPEFVASIDIFRLLTVSVAFQCLAVLPGFYLMAIDRQNWLVPMGLAAIAFEYLVGRQVIASGGGLTGVAMTMSIGSFLYCTAVLLYAGGFAFGSTGGTLVWIGKVYFPAAFFAGVVAGIRWVTPHTPLAEAGEVARASIQGVVFLGLSLPMLTAFERRHHVLARLRRRR